MSIPSFSGSGFRTLLLFWFCCSAAIAQTVVPANNPNDTTRRFPVTSWYDYNRTQILFKSAELGFATKRILSVGFYVQSRGNNVKNSAVKIRIKTTADTVVSPVAYLETIAGTTEVYSGVVSKDSIMAGKWLNLKLQTPFDYTGSGNLMILIESQTDVPGNNDGDDNSKRFRFSATNAPRFQKWWSDHFIPSGNGVVENFRPNVQFGLADIPGPCSGMPEGGTAVVSNSLFPCSGGSIQLSLTGYSQNLGIGLQWQRKSPSATGNWEDIPGATFEDLSQTVTGTADYRCKVTCTTSNQSAFSNPAQVVVSAPALAIPVSEGFTGLVQTEGQAFPLGCGYLGQNISGTRGWRGTLGRNPDQPRFRGVAGRTDSAAVYSGWSTESYFFLPAMALSPDSTYSISFWYKHSRNGDNNEGPSFDVRVGDLPEASAQNTLLISKNNQNDTTFQLVTASYHPETAGTYHFSIRNKTLSGNPFFLVVDDIEVTKALFVGVKEASASGRVSVFPNPNRGSFQVALPKGIREGNLEITDLNGKQVGLFSIESEKPLRLQGYNPGLFLFKVYTQHTVYTGKLVVE